MRAGGDVINESAAMGFTWCMHCQSSQRAIECRRHICWLAMTRDPLVEVAKHDCWQAIAELLQELSDLRATFKMFSPRSGIPSSGSHVAVAPWDTDRDYSDRAKRRVGDACHNSPYCRTLFDGRYFSPRRA